VCKYHCAQLSYTQHSTEQFSQFSVILQAIIIAQKMCNGYEIYIVLNIFEID